MKSCAKILSLLGLLGVMMLLVSLPAIGVSNAEPTVRIAHHNIAFGNNVYVLYAVDTENVGNAPQLFMEIRVGNDDLSEPDAVSLSYEYRSLTDMDAENKDPEKYYIFAYTGLNAAQMADTIYARAGVTVNGETYYSETDSYSVCEYAARKLGLVDGVSGTTDTELRNLLLAMLDYGSHAQEYLEYNSDTPANKFYLTFGDTETPTAGVLYGEKADGTMEVTGYEGGTDTRVVIAGKDPETGKLVTSIGNNAFSRNSSIKEVILPATIETIGDLAFENCKALTLVEMRNGVISIGQKAFSGCSRLESLALPASLTTLGTAVFPTNDGFILQYSGTKEQLFTLLNNNPGWNSLGQTCIFILPNGEECRLPD